MPKLVRLYITQVAWGFVISAVFVGVLLAWQIRRARRSLMAFTAWLEATEQAIAQDLPQAVAYLKAGGAASRRAAQQVTQLKRQWQLLQQLLTLLSLGQAFRRRWRR